MERWEGLEHPHQHKNTHTHIHTHTQFFALFSSFENDATNTYPNPHDFPVLKMMHTYIHKIPAPMPKPTPCPHDAAALVINLLLLICFFVIWFCSYLQYNFFIALFIANNTDSKQCKSTVDIVNQTLHRWKEFAIKDDRAQQVRQDTKILLSVKDWAWLLKRQKCSGANRSFESWISHTPTQSHPHPHNHTHTHPLTTTSTPIFELFSGFEINAKVINHGCMIFLFWKWRD